MSIGPADEALRAGDDPAFRDAVTFSFGDPAAAVYGLARLGVGGGAASGFAVVYAGDELAGASTQSAALDECASRVGGRARGGRAVLGRDRARGVDGQLRRP